MYAERVSGIGETRLLNKSAARVPCLSAFQTSASVLCLQSPFLPKFLFFYFYTIIIIMIIIN